MGVRFRGAFTVRVRGAFSLVVDDRQVSEYYISDELLAAVVIRTAKHRQYYK